MVLTIYCCILFCKRTLWSLCSEQTLISVWSLVCILSRPRSHHTYKFYSSASKHCSYEPAYSIIMNFQMIDPSVSHTRPLSTTPDWSVYLFDRQVLLRTSRRWSIMMSLSRLRMLNGFFVVQTPQSVDKTSLTGTWWQCLTTDSFNKRSLLWI